MDPLNNQSKNLSSVPDSLLQDSTVDQQDQVFDTTKYRNPMPLPASLEKYRAYLPSKRIIVGVAVLLVVLIGYIIIPKIPTFIRVVKNMFTHQSSLPASRKPVGVATTETDSDGDGIPDWQEALFNLDPADTDSNNDGVPDSVPADAQKLANDPNIITQSDKLVLQILAEINKDGGIDNLTQAQLSEKVQTEILKTAENVESGFTSYSQSDLTMADNSLESVRTYKSTIDRINKEIIPSKDVIRKIYSFISVADTKQYPSFYMSTLQGNVTTLLKTPVPRSLSDDHLKLINSISRLYGFVTQLHTDQGFYENTDSYIKTIIIQKNLNAIAKSVDNINLYFSIYNK